MSYHSRFIIPRRYHTNIKFALSFSQTTLSQHLYFNLPLWLIHLLHLQLFFLASHNFFTSFLNSTFYLHPQIHKFTQKFQVAFIYSYLTIRITHFNKRYFTFSILIQPLSSNTPTKPLTNIPTCPHFQQNCHLELSTTTSLPFTRLRLFPILWLSLHLKHH